jgi:hypothetical protein
VGVAQESKGAKWNHFCVRVQICPKGKLEEGEVKKKKMGSFLLVLVVLVASILVALGQRGPGECAHLCNDLRRDILTLDMCK